jgi:SAM-dependent methyltransferase
MRLKVVAENWLERIALGLGLAPIPMVDTMQAMISARAIMAASRLGVFQQLSPVPLTLDELADQLQLNPYALEKLLGVLVATNYVQFHKRRYRLTRLSKKWMLPVGKSSLHDNMQLRYLEWQAMDRLEEFVETGHALDAHETLQGDDWDVYQQGLADVARLAASEIARRIRLQPDARSMLDIGGSHGQYTAAVCRRFPLIDSTILELPQAIAAASRIFQEFVVNEPGLAQRVKYCSGDALHFPLGRAEYDLVFISQLIHHFSEAENRDLVQRAAHALRSGGTLAIVDAIRPRQPSLRCQTGQVLDLFFAVTSKSGTWPLGHVQEWLVSAGLRLLPAVPIRTLPGVVMIAATQVTAP